MRSTLPPGWRKELHHAKCRTYPTFHGPCGAHTKSATSAWKAYNDALKGEHIQDGDDNIGVDVKGFETELFGGGVEDSDDCSDSEDGFDQLMRVSDDPPEYFIIETVRADFTQPAVDFSVKRVNMSDHPRRMLQLAFGCAPPPSPTLGDLVHFVETLPEKVRVLNYKLYCLVRTNEPHPALEPSGVRLLSAKQAASALGAYEKVLVGPVFFLVNEMLLEPPLQ